MNIEFNYIDAQDIQKTLKEFKEFKERYLDIATGRREVNDDNLELERIAVVLEAEQILENLHDSLKEFEQENPLYKEKTITI